MARNLGRIAGGALPLAIADLATMQWLDGGHAYPALFDPASTDRSPFRLTDEDSGTVTKTTWRCRFVFVLLHVGNRSCPDVCPTRLAKILEAFEKRPEAARARVVVAFATVDPERDDQAALRDDTELSHPALTGLTGTEAQTDAAARGFRVYHRRVTEGPDADDYLFDISASHICSAPISAPSRWFPQPSPPRQWPRNLRARSAQPLPRGDCHDSHSAHPWCCSALRLSPHRRSHAPATRRR